MHKKLFVSNLSFRTTEDQLQQLFALHGEVLSAAIATHQDSERSRGFGFVEMASSENAKEAIDALNNIQLGGRSLRVALSEPRERRLSTAYGSLR